MCLKSWLEMCVSCDYKAPLVLYGDSVPPTLFLCDSPLPEREREHEQGISGAGLGFRVTITQSCSIGSGLCLIISVWDSKS